MKKKDFLLLIEDVLEVDEGSLNGTEALEDLEMWDSLAVVTFIALVDEHLEMSISPEKISAAKSVSDLLALTGDKLND
ncbi:MAG: hypothetical protein C0631_04085 [Sedimenticola sp.]|nr:MAG: hypothetical protein C0631_04085 [Sedimenticola sp.]